MKVEIKTVTPPPPPPQEVVLTLSPAEARALCDLMSCDHPDAPEVDGVRIDGIVFLELDPALYRAGINE
jgi:hypothetical protein